MTGNTLITHVMGGNCKLTDKDKKTIIDIMSLKTANRRAWLIADGAEAVADEQWWKSVVVGQRSINEWRFDAPRRAGYIKPSTYSRFSISRIGSANPMCIAHRPDYDIKEIKLFAKQSLRLILDSNSSFIS